MINFYLPDFYYLYRLNISIINYLKQHPEYFYDNITIKAIYGAFPPSIWNGGRAMTGYTDRNNIKATLQDFNNLGVACRYTYTNCLLTENDLNDRFCNTCMEIGNNGKNEVLVNSKILENYIRKNYKNYKIIASTTKGINTPEALDKELETFDMVVADYTMNNTNELFQVNNKDRVEILLNTNCSDYCVYRQEHYKAVSTIQLGQDFPEFECPKCRDKSFTYNMYDVMNENKSYVKAEDLYNVYVPAGFKNFKIEGRNMNQYEVLEYYMYYLVKPERRDKVRVDLIFEITR